MGILSLDDLRPFLFEEGLLDVAVARDLAGAMGPVLAPIDDLEHADKVFLTAATDELPVLDPVTRQVVGILRQRDLHAAYNQAIERLA